METLVTLRSLRTTACALPPVTALAALTVVAAITQGLALFPGMELAVLDAVIYAASTSAELAQARELIGVDARGVEPVLVHGADPDLLIQVVGIIGVDRPVRRRLRGDGLGRFGRLAQVELLHDPHGDGGEGPRVGVPEVEFIAVVSAVPGLGDDILRFIHLVAIATWP